MNSQTKFNFSDITSYQDILTISGLDFKVNKYPVIANNIESKEYFGLVSDKNDFFGIAKKNYTIIQNDEFFSFIDLLLQNDFVVKNAYQYKSKSIIKIQDKNELKVEKIGDLFNTFIYIKNDFSGKDSGSYQIYNVRLACTNGMKRNYKESEFVIKHFSTYKSKLELVSEMLQNLDAYKRNLTHSIEIMNESYISDTKFNEYINNILKIDTNKDVSTRIQNVKNNIIDIYNNKEDLQGLNKSYYRAFNAVSDYFSNHMNFKNSNNNELIKETSLVFGNNIDKSFELALELSQN